MVPGVSRSGATILGGMLSGLDKRTAAEFSFFLAIPTMCGAVAYDLYKNWSVLTVDSWALIITGFVVAFITALLVIRTLLNYLTRHGFALFGYYRICLGTLVLALLYL
jgi:undecaprenyl-diphosphatase